MKASICSSGKGVVGFLDDSGPSIDVEFDRDATELRCWAISAKMWRGRRYLLKFAKEKP